MYALWGRVDITPFLLARETHSFRVRLSLYLPGTTSAERRWLHAYGMFVRPDVQIILWGFVTLYAAFWRSWLVALVVGAALSALWTLMARRTSKARKTVQQFSVRCGVA